MTFTHPAPDAPPLVISPALKLRVITTIIAVDLIATLFMVDQVSKWTVLEGMIKPLVAPDALRLDFIAWLSASDLPRLPFADIAITPFFNIVMVWNEGVSFGVLSGHNGAANIFLVTFLSAIVLGFSVWMLKTSSAFLRLTLAVVIGGALGNIWDRIRFGAVADFLDFHAYGVHYPAFNVADSCIVLGIAALVAYELLYGSSRKPKATPDKVT